MMLLSNWDDKDSRDADSRGTNTAIYRAGDHDFYFIDDWGGAMGGWGKFFTRSKWNCDSFSKQSKDFVRVENGALRWGYVGQHSALMTSDIQPADVAWLMRYLGRVTPDQLRAGLLASGATEEQAGCYVDSLGVRIAQLQKVQ
jgi:hypothetical protein